MQKLKNVPMSYRKVPVLRTSDNVAELRQDSTVSRLRSQYQRRYDAT